MYGFIVLINYIMFYISFTVFNVRTALCIYIYWIGDVDS